MSHVNQNSFGLDRRAVTFNHSNSAKEINHLRNQFIDPEELNRMELKLYTKLGGPASLLGNK